MHKINLHSTALFLALAIILGRFRMLKFTSSSSAALLFDFEFDSTIAERLRHSNSTRWRTKHEWLTDVKKYLCSVWTEKSNLRASERALVCEKRREKMKKKLETKANQQFGAEQKSGHGEMDLSPSERSEREFCELCSKKWTIHHTMEFRLYVSNSYCRHELRMCRCRHRFGFFKIRAMSARKFCPTWKMQIFLPTFFCSSML